MSNQPSHPGEDKAQRTDNFTDKITQAIENTYLTHGHKTDKDRYRNFVLLCYILKCIETYEQTAELNERINNPKK